MPDLRHFRAFARKNLSLPAIVATEATGPGPARLLNLGLGGACVELEAVLAVGSPVTLEVTAPNLWDPLVVLGVVAWSRPTASGTIAGFAFNHARTGSASLPALVELLDAYRYE